MTSDKSKSLERSKKTTVSLADILVKEGVTSLIPGAGLTYELGKALFSHGISFFKDRTENRISEFHEELLRDVDEQNIDKLLRTEFDIADYHKLLVCCANDIEDEKTTTYATFMKNLIFQKIIVMERRHFIKTLNESTFLDLELLRKIYINQKFDLMTVGGSTTQLEQIYKAFSEFESMNVYKFINFGLLEKNKNYIELTQLGLKFVGLVYEQNKLLPESIGKKRFKNVTLFIVSHELGGTSKHVEFSTWLQKELWEKQIKCSIGMVRERNNILWGAIFNGFILLLGDKALDAPIIQEIAKASKHTPVIRINTTDMAKTQQLDGVKLLGEYNVYLQDIEQAKRQAKEIIDKVMS